MTTVEPAVPNSDDPHAVPAASAWSELTSSPAPLPGVTVPPALNAVCEQLWVQWQRAQQGGNGLLDLPHWNTAALRWPDWSLEVQAQVDSTNTALMERARAGDRSAALLVAVHQTAGRGRRGRVWRSQPGDGLTFSVGVPMAPADWSGLSLAVGVSLAQSLTRGIQARWQPDWGPVPQDLFQLKWPNDLWLYGAKLGGVLVETAHASEGRYAVIGVGLNLALPPAQPPAPTADEALSPQPVAGLRSVLPQVDMAEVLGWVVPALMADLAAFEAHGFGGFHHRFDRLDALRGLPLRLSDGTEGVAAGLSDDGALRLNLPDGGQRHVHAGEVSVRPATAGAQPPHFGEAKS